MEENEFGAYACRRRSVFHRRCENKQSRPSRERIGINRTETIEGGQRGPSGANAEGVLVNANVNGT